MLKGVSTPVSTQVSATLSRTRSASSLPSPPSSEPSDTAQLSSKEFKMLLQPSKFEDVDKGIKKLWHKIEDAAESVGVETKKAKKPEVRTQDIVFLDTDDHALKDQGFILRYRDIHGSSKDDNLTLKFRDSDAAKVAVSDVSAAPESAVKSKFELDETFGETVGHVYSKSTKVKLPELPETNVGAMSEVFPSLNQLGLEPSTKLKNLHEGLVEERHLLGNLQISESESAPAYLTLWYDQDHKETPAVAEFSFAHSAHEAHSGIDQNSEELMGFLRDDAPRWLSQGSTKTNFAYSE